MDPLIAELEEIATAMVGQVDTWEAAGHAAALDALVEEADKVGKSWSGSPIGYHATVYYEGFQPPPAGSHFAPDWGFMSIGDTRGRWKEYPFDDVRTEIERRAGTPNLDAAWALATSIGRAFEAAHRAAASILDVALAQGADPYLDDAKSRLRDLRPRTATQFMSARMPKQYATRDQLAGTQGLRFAPHLVVRANVSGVRSPALASRQLADLAGEVAQHLRRRATLAARAPAPAPVPDRLSPQADTSSCDVLLVTVTDVETKAVMASLCAEAGDPTLTFGETKTYFRFKPINSTSVVLVRSEMGSDTVGGASTTIRDAIAEVRPTAIMMVGIAFGVDEEKQPVGTVLVSKQLLAYELQRMGTNEATGQPEVTARGDRVTASPVLLDRLRTAELNWSGDVKFGLVLSGQKLVDNLDYRRELEARHPEAVGGEMEGAGLYSAAAGKAEWIVVKAVCDWADGGKRVDKAARQKTAAEAAASLVLHTIRQGGLAPRDGS